MNRSTKKYNGKYIADIWNEEKDDNGLGHIIHVDAEKVDIIIQKLGHYEDLEWQGKLFGTWIPCSERLPEEPIPETFHGLVEMDSYPEYIVTIKGATEATVLKYAGNGEWYSDGIFYNVTAWQPLPEAYKG